jgi:hypothetical protein
MNLQTGKKRLFVILKISLIGIFSLFGEYTRAENPVVRTMPAELEKELKELELKQTANSGDVNQLLRMANLYLDMGYGIYRDREKKLSAFQEGARVAQKALDLSESSADAHFLYAANLGSAAELEGLMAGALIIQQIKRHVQRVLELDNHYVPAHHMLGRIYEELPWLLGGDSKAAGEHFKMAVSLDHRYAPAHLDLAKWYLKHGQKRDAVRELKEVIETPPLKKRWMWERIHRPEAHALLQQLLAEEASESFQANP